MDCSRPGSSVQGILQARILGLPCPLSGHLLDPGIKLKSFMSLCHFQAVSLPLVPPGGDAIWIFNFDILVKDREAEFSGSPDEGTWRGCSGSGKEKQVMRECRALRQRGAEVERHTEQSMPQNWDLMQPVNFGEHSLERTGAAKGLSAGDEGK